MCYIYNINNFIGMYVLVEIQYCKNCHHHSWCSRHDEIKYIDFFEQLSYRLSIQFPNVKVEQRKPAAQLQQKKYTAKQQNKYINRITGQTVIFPRSGAFEVYVDGMRMYSKIRTKKWPKFDKILQTIHHYIDAKNDNQSIHHFDIDYIDPIHKQPPITNADLYDIKTIFRVRKPKQQSQQLNKTLSISQHHSQHISPASKNPKTIQQSQLNKIHYFQQKYPNINSRNLNDWKISSSETKNIYLREMFMKGGNTSRYKKNRLKLIKDDLRGSITIEGSNGEKQIYYKELQRKSRANSRRRKLKPLQQSLTLDTGKFQDDDAIQTNNFPINQFNLHSESGSSRMYRQRMLIKKKKQQLEAIQNQNKQDSHQRQNEKCQTKQKQNGEKSEKLEKLRNKQQEIELVLENQDNCKEQGNQDSEKQEKKEEQKQKSQQRESEIDGDAKEDPRDEKENIKQKDEQQNNQLIEQLENPENPQTTKIQMQMKIHPYKQIPHQIPQTFEYTWQTNYLHSQYILSLQHSTQPLNKKQIHPPKQQQQPSQLKYTQIIENIVIDQLWNAKYFGGEYHLIYVEQSLGSERDLKDVGLVEDKMEIGELDVCKWDTSYKDQIYYIVGKDTDGNIKEKGLQNISSSQNKNLQQPQNKQYDQVWDCIYMDHKFQIIPLN